MSMFRSEQVARFAKLWCSPATPGVRHRTSHLPFLLHCRSNSRFTIARDLAGTAQPLRRSLARSVTVHKGPNFCESRSLSTEHTSERPSVTCTVKEVSPGHEVATITIRNPRKLNIVNRSVLDSLVSTCKNLSSNQALRAVILTGGPTAAGKQPSFIGGADITEMHRLASSESAKTFITRIHTACAAIRNLPVPVIARIHGFALGAGLEIAASCDLRIATKTSTLGMPEVLVGIPSVVEAAYLPGLIGMGRTRRLLYLAENISATEAERWGLVERVVDGEAELDAVLTEWASRIADMGPKAIRVQKRLMQKWENVGVDEGVAAGVEAFGEAYDDGGIEPRELMGKFLDRSRT